MRLTAPSRPQSLKGGSKAKDARFKVSFGICDLVRALQASALNTSKLQGIKAAESSHLPPESALHSQRSTFYEQLIQYNTREDKSPHCTVQSWQSKQCQPSSEKKSQSRQWGEHDARGLWPSTCLHRTKGQASRDSAAHLRLGSCA